MGEMVEIFCKDCDYKEGFSLGVGMDYSSLENVLELVPPASRKEIKSIIHDYEDWEGGGEHALLHCGKCNALYERFRVRIVYETINGWQKTYETHHSCSKCHSALTPVNTSEDDEDYRSEHEILAPFIAELPCPKCANKSLSIENRGYWD
jgi:hypothetical protein